MVELNMFSRSAPCAGFIGPCATLFGGEIPSITARHAGGFCNGGGVGLEHDISIDAPSFFEGGAHFCAMFWRRTPSTRPTFAARSARSDGVPDPLSRPFVVDFAPEGIAFSAERDSFALLGTTGIEAVVSGKVMGGSVNKLSTHDALDVSSGFWRCHIDENGVNSVETPLYDNVLNGAIPSEAAQECAERVTTRPWSPERTVKAHERAARKGRDSLSHAVTHGSADKEPCDNNTDEVLNIAPQDVISASSWDIKQAACAVTVSGLEMIQNAGKEQVIDLIDARMDVAESSLMNLISTGVYSDGTGSGGQQITGLQAIISNSPTTGTVGGINRANYSFWRNQTLDFSATLGASAGTGNIYRGFNLLWARCTRGPDTPDLIVVDNTYWEFYLASLQNNARFAGDSGLADFGFTSLKFMNADVVLDGGIGGDAPSQQAFFINSKYLFFRPFRERNFVALGDERLSTNQDAVIRLIGWAGNVTCSGAQFQGVAIE